MRVQLKALFILVAIAAAISSWLAQRRTPLYPGALVQIVDPVQANPASASRHTDFENAFYTLLVDKLATEHPDIVIGTGDPNIQIREVIRLKLMAESDRTTLFSVHVWGNALTSDRERLKSMMKTAVEALNALSEDKSRVSTIKILITPSL
jgi:hypothetical protein